MGWLNSWSFNFYVNLYMSYACVKAEFTLHDRYAVIRVMNPM